jgi:hypothetical protein
MYNKVNTTNVDHCQHIRTVIAGFIIGAAVSLLIFDNRVSHVAAALGIFCLFLAMFMWAVFYANPITDQSSINFNIFIQAAVVITGILVFAFENNKETKTK